MDVIQAAPRTAQYVVLAVDAGLPSERVLTGTANQITVTDNGAGSTVVLSAPQNLHTAATPTFAGLTLSGLTAGRVPYASTAGLLADSANLTWDNSNVRLGIGTSAPGNSIHVTSDVAGIARFDTFVGSAQGAGLIAYKGRGTAADPRRTQSADNLGFYNARGYYAADDVSTATAMAINAGVFAFAAVETFTSTGTGTEWMLRTTPAGGTTLTTGLALSDRGNLVIGTGKSASQPSTGTKVLIFEDGTAPSSLASNSAGLYADDVSGTVNLFAIAEDGTTTRLTWGTPQTYSESNATTDRTYDANATSLDEVADVLGTLIGDLRARGIVA